MIMHIMLYMITWFIVMSVFLTVYLWDVFSIFLRSGKMKKDAELALAVERVINGEIEIINKKVVKKKI